MHIHACHRVPLDGRMHGWMDTQMEDRQMQVVRRYRSLAAMCPVSCPYLALQYRADIDCLLCLVGESYRSGYSNRTIFFLWILS